MATGNSINANTQGTQYLSSAGVWAGVDAGTATHVLTSNGTGVAPSFQAAGGGGGGASLSPYIVGTTGTSDYATIQAAIDQAVIDGASATSQKNIYVKAGTYTENLTVPDGINIIGFGPMPSFDNSSLDYSSDLTNPSKLIGTITFSGGDSKIYNLFIAPPLNSSPFIWAAFSVPTIVGCDIRATGTSTIMFDVGVVGGNLIMSDCIGTVTVGLSYNGYLFSLAAGTFLQPQINSCFLAAGNASVVGAGSALFLFTCNSTYFLSIDATAGDASVTAYNSNFTTNGISPLITGGASTAETMYYYNCVLFANGAPTAWDLPAACTVYVSGGQLTGKTTITGGANLIKNFVAQDPTTPASVIVKNSTNFSGSEFVATQGAVQTTNATPTLIMGPLVNQLESIAVKGIVIGSLANHTASVGGTFDIVARRASGGNITIVGTATVGVHSDTAATFTAVVTTGTQTVDVQVTGVAATTYNWTCTFEYQKILTNA